MADTFKSQAGYAQATTVEAVALGHDTSRERANAGPAGGLLIAVGTSLILWAVLVEAVRFASWVLF